MKSVRHGVRASWMLAGIASLSPVGSALQGQPVTNDDRQAGLALREVIEGQTTGFGNAAFLTVSGPPGSIYELFGGIAILAPGGGFDTQVEAPGVLGPVSAPVSLLPGSLFVPRSGTFGVIPASCTQDLDLSIPFPTGLAGLFLEVQVLMQRPGAPMPPLTVGNGQIRQIQGAYSPTQFYFGESQVPNSTVDDPLWADIEQGDVDGDGDNDTVGVGTRGVFLWTTVAGVRDPMSTRLWPSNATSAEFADIDDDGFLDLAVAMGGAQFLRVWVNQGLDASGNWLGFVEMSSAKSGFPTALGPSFPADIEAGDLDGDGDLDLFFASAFAPATGMQNRMFFNQLVQTGTGSFVDVTTANLPAILDDSEDCEIFDFDLDGDLDVVIANVDGQSPNTPFGEGGDYVLVNQGSPSTPSLEGFFLAPLPNPLPTANDESLDVAVGDVNGDGLPDLYFTNWQFTAGPGNGTGLPVSDRLLLRGFDANGDPAFLDVSGQLPDQSAETATFGTDAEIVDTDLDGDQDIVLGLGTLSGFSSIAVTPAPGLSTGLVILDNQVGSFASTTPFIAPTDPSTFDFRDVEHGDWREATALSGFARYFQVDLGCALTGASAQLVTLDHL